MHLPEAARGDSAALKLFYAQELKILAEAESNVTVLLKYSRAAKDPGYLDLAEKITEKVLRAEPQNSAAIARLYSIMRAKGQPQRALDAISRLPEKFQGHAVPISGAAALCDLYRWAEADKIIRLALGQLKGRPKMEATEAFSVYGRIQHFGDA